MDVHLSAREQDVLQFIKNYMQQHGQAPLLGEIAAGVGISSKGVIHRYLVALETAGVIARDGRHRGIRLLDTEPRHSLPFLGSIAAGVPIEAINTAEHIDLASLLGAEGDFVLRVTGASMRDKGILDGDLVIIDSRAQAANGDVVVALIDDSEVTLKTLQNRRDAIYLLPANDDFAVGKYAHERVKIQGVLKAQLRLYS